MAQHSALALRLWLMQVEGALGAAREPLLQQAWGGGCRHGDGGRKARGSRAGGRLAGARGATGHRGQGARMWEWRMGTEAKCPGAGALPAVPRHRSSLPRRRRAERLGCQGHHQTGSKVGRQANARWQRGMQAGRRAGRGVEIGCQSSPILLHPLLPPPGPGPLTRPPRTPTYLIRCVPILYCHSSEALAAGPKQPAPALAIVEAPPLALDWPGTLQPQQVAGRQAGGGTHPTCGHTLPASMLGATLTAAAIKLGTLSCRPVQFRGVAAAMGSAVQHTGHLPTEGMLTCRAAPRYAHSP